MAHYFTKENNELESKVHRFKCFVGEKEYTFSTDLGVFSKKGLDFGTRLLLETILSDPSGPVLDLGCGYGPIGIILADHWKESITMVDINRRALALTRTNAALNKVAPAILESDGFDNVSGWFSLIVTNPPIRAGKQTYYEWFDDSRSYLALDGRLVFVMRKDQGANSAIAYLQDLFGSVSILRKKSGYFIISCQNPLTI